MWNATKFYSLCILQARQFTVVLRTDTKGVRKALCTAGPCFPGSGIGRWPTVRAVGTSLLHLRGVVGRSVVQASSGGGGAKRQREVRCLLTRVDNIVGNKSYRYQRSGKGQTGPPLRERVDGKWLVVEQPTILPASQPLMFLSHSDFTSSRQEARWPAGDWENQVLVMARNERLRKEMGDSAGGAQRKGGNWWVGGWVVARFLGSTVNPVRCWAAAVACKSVVLERGSNSQHGSLASDSSHSSEGCLSVGSESRLRLVRLPILPG